MREKEREKIEKREKERERREKEKKDISKEKKREKREKMSRVNYYQSAFNSQKEKYIGRNAQNVKKWPYV